MFFVLALLFLVSGSASAVERLDTKLTKDAPKKDKSALGDFILELLGRGKYNHGGYGETDEHYENDGYTGSGGYGGYEGLVNSGYGHGGYHGGYGYSGYQGNHGSYGHGSHGNYGGGKGYGRPPIGVVVLVPEELFGDYGGYRGGFQGYGGGGGYGKSGSGKKIA